MDRRLRCSISARFTPAVQGERGEQPGKSTLLYLLEYSRGYEYAVQGPGRERLPDGFRQSDGSGREHAQRARHGPRGRRGLALITVWRKLGDVWARSTPDLRRRTL